MNKCPTMAAVVGHALGSLDNYAIEKIPIPEPRPHEVRLRVMTAGVSYVDALTAMGRYQITPTLPYIPGSECAGIVDAVGDCVRSVRTGDRVSAISMGGVFAEALCVPETDVSHLPANMPWDAAAIIRVAYTTALHALRDRGALTPGERLLVLGAGGATGQAAIQIGKALGAFVVGAASNAEKRAAASVAGANRTIDSSPDAFRDEIDALCNGNGVDLIFDPVGGGAGETAFRALSRGGRYLVVGFTGGIANIAVNQVLLKGVSIVGVNVGRFKVVEPAAAANGLVRVYSLFSEGLVRPNIGHRFALSAFAQAMELALSGRACSRIIMQIQKLPAA